MTARRERKTILCVFLFFLKNRVERGRGGKKKQGRKRLAAKERAEVVLEREEEGERGWRRRERERERRIQNDAFEGDQ